MDARKIEILVLNIQSEGRTKAIQTASMKFRKYLLFTKTCKQGPSQHIYTSENNTENPVEETISENS